MLIWSRGLDTELRSRIKFCNFQEVCIGLVDAMKSSTCSWGRFFLHWVSLNKTLASQIAMEKQTLGLGTRWARGVLSKVACPKPTRNDGLSIQVPDCILWRVFTHPRAIQGHMLISSRGLD